MPFQLEFSLVRTLELIRHYYREGWLEILAFDAVISAPVGFTSFKDSRRLALSRSLGKRSAIVQYKLPLAGGFQLMTQGRLRF